MLCRKITGSLLPVALSAAICILRAYMVNSASQSFRIEGLLTLEYDYLIVGSGLFGAVFAHEAVKKGKKCLVIDKRNHTGGNIYCEETEGVTVHRYGAHIFHKRQKSVGIRERTVRIQQVHEHPRGKL